jgi:hypothetical protein
MGKKVVNRSKPARKPVMSGTELRYGVAGSLLLVCVYMLVVLYGLDIIDNYLRPLVHMYEGLRR